MRKNFPESFVFFFTSERFHLLSLHFLSVSALSKGCFGPGQSKRERKARIKRERTPESFIPPFRLVNRVNAATYCDLGGRTLATNCPITFPVSYSQVRKTPGVPLAPLQVWTAQPTFVAAFQTICVKWPVADYTSPRNSGRTKTTAPMEHGAPTEILPVETI